MIPFIISMLTDQWADVFDTYHRCDSPTNIKIFHRNGCGPTPQTCNHKLSNSSQLSRIYDLHVNVEGLWESLSSLSKWDSLQRGNLNKLSYVLNDVVIMNCVLEAKQYCMQIRGLKVPLN